MNIQNVQWKILFIPYKHQERYFSIVFCCCFTSHRDTLRLKTRCYQKLNWRNTNVYLWSGRRAPENWVLQGTPEFSVFIPPPPFQIKNISKLCTLDLRCQRKECYLVNYNLGHLCCRVTHRVLTQKRRLIN